MSNLFGSNNKNNDKNLEVSNRFAQKLIERGIIDDDQLNLALTEKRKNNQRLGETLIDLNFVDNNTINELLKNDLGYKFINVNNLELDINLLQQIGEDFCKDNRAIPFKKDEQGIHIALTDPQNLILKDAIKKHLLKIFNKNINCIFYGTTSFSIKDALQKLQIKQKIYDDEFESLFLNIFEDAFAKNVSDVHFVPYEKMIVLKYRKNGKLEIAKHLSISEFEKIAIKAKIICNLDIAEKRNPQSGSCTLNLSNTQIECRFSFHPCIYGESLVIRLLNNNSINALDIDSLGFDPNIIETLKQIANLDYGLFLICGATGSGKTTTLQALLRTIDHKNKNIITLEQPIEYKIEGIRQTEIKDDGILSFANGIRSALRHDPDVLLIGEVRDDDTAQMAVRACLTGHLVLTTIHASSPFSAPYRLMDLGVSNKMLAGQIIGVLSQDLITDAYGNRKANGKLVLFNDAMHQALSNGSSPYELEQIYLKTS